MSSSNQNLTAVLGPTNTGKTHLAVERMLAHGSGIMGLPLRLLAREIYDRVVAAKGAKAAALVTGEEKIIPPTARYFICTTEAMPVSRRFDFVGLDEIQLAGDHERGHVFTDRLLHCRGTQETMFMGSATMTSQVRHLTPEFHHENRERFSQLTYGGPSKLTRLPRRSAIIAFSAERVYAIAELVRRRRGGAAVVMGGLSPRTRNAQVGLYQSGEVDFLIATDAIGMGLNMDVDHVAFADTKKFDGRRFRTLTAAELGQIAGRAGRFRTDGTFGETADSRPLTPDMVEAVEHHRFAPVQKLQWRNPLLDESSIRALQHSLNRPPPDKSLERVREAIDELTLNELARDADVRDRLTSRGLVARLWDTCRLPDFRKATVDAHARLVKTLYMHLTEGNGLLPHEFLHGQLAKLDKMSGDVDALAARLSHVRTWAYAANRADWTSDPVYWQGRTRDLEDRLSDALHERLIQRFVDRRTSALVKGLRGEREMLAGVNAAGEVTVEGHYLGRLEGLVFKPDVRGKELEARMLKSAAFKALRPEVNQRLGEIAEIPASDLKLAQTGMIEWQEFVIARLVPGPDTLKPGVKLVGGELGAGPAIKAAETGLETWIRTRVEDVLAPLLALKAAAEDLDVPGSARGLAFRLFEAGGALPRHEIADEVKALGPPERSALRKAGVRFGEHAIFLPAMLKPAAAELNAILRDFNAPDRGTDEPVWMPAPGLTSIVNDRARSRPDYVARGFYPCGPRAVRLDMLERLADMIRDARQSEGEMAGKFELSAGMNGLLGCSVEDLRGVLSSLRYRCVKTGEDPEKAAGEIWGMRKRRPDQPRRKHDDSRGGTQGERSDRGDRNERNDRRGGPKREGRKPRPVSRDVIAPEPVDMESSPFAALAELKLATPEPAPKKRKRRKPKKKPAETANPASQDEGDTPIVTSPEPAMKSQSPAADDTPVEPQTPETVPSETVSSEPTNGETETSPQTSSS